MDRKYLPQIVMLLAGAITCVIIFPLEFTFPQKLLILFLVLFGFYIFGFIMKWTLDKFYEQNENREQEDGAVIEKGADEPEEEQS